MPTVVAESPRLLHVRSEHGYTDRIDQALADEPEAVSVDCQRRLVEHAARAARRRTRVVFVARRVRIERELRALRELRVDGVDVDSDVRVIERTLDRLDRRIRSRL